MGVGSRSPAVLRALGPEAHHFRGDRAIVGRAAVLAARAPRRETRLRADPGGPRIAGTARCSIATASRRIGPGWPRSAASRAALADQKVRQPVEIALVEQHRPGPLVRQHVLAEGGRQRGEPFADRGEARLRFGRQPGAGAGEVEMRSAQSARACSGVRPSDGCVRLQGVDPPEQRVVQIGVAGVARQDRRDGALDRFELVVRLGAGEIEKDAWRPGRGSARSAPAPRSCWRSVGGAGSAATASISARASFRAASKAGAKCRGAMRSNGGASNGPVQASRRGLAFGFGRDIEKLSPSFVGFERSRIGALEAISASIRPLSPKASATEEAKARGTRPFRPNRRSSKARNFGGRLSDFKGVELEGYEFEIGPDAPFAVFLHYSP